MKFRSGLQQYERPFIDIGQERQSGLFDQHRIGGKSESLWLRGHVLKVRHCTSSCEPRAKSAGNQRLVVVNGRTTEESQYSRFVNEYSTVRVAEGCRMMHSRS